MSIGNITDLAVRNELRRLLGEVQRIQKQISLLIDQSNVSSGVSDHTELDNIGTNTHAQIDTHIADGTKHFLEGDIDHTAIQNIGTNTHAQIDTHIAGTSNPHTVTLQQATDAGAVTTTNSSFDSGIEVDGNPASQPHILCTRDTSANGTFLIRSNTIAGSPSAQPGYEFNVNGLADTHTIWTDNADATLMTLGTTAGLLYVGQDTDDQYIHEKMSAVDPTGTWDFTNATVQNIGQQGIAVQNGQPAFGRERIWLQPNGGAASTGAIYVDFTGSGPWVPFGVEGT